MKIVLIPIGKINISQVVSLLVRKSQVVFCHGLIKKIDLVGISGAEMSVSH